MISEGLEAFVGVRRDPDFGLVIAAGLGGVGIEVFRDFALRLLPLAEGEAQAMIAELKGYPLLRGARSPQPYDIAAFAEVIERVGALAFANRDHLDQIDLNPVKIFAPPSGCRIVDALIVPSRRTRGLNEQARAPCRAIHGMSGTRLLGPIIKDNQADRARVDLGAPKVRARPAR